MNDNHTLAVYLNNLVVVTLCYHNISIKLISVSLYGVLYWYNMYFRIIIFINSKFKIN